MSLEYTNTEAGFTAQAGENITIGDAVALNSSTGYVYRANAQTGSSQQTPCVGFATSTVASGEQVGVVQHGRMAGASGLTPGAAVYLGESDGAVTKTAPTTSGDIVQVVGIANLATEFTIEIDIATTTVS